MATFGAPIFGGKTCFDSSSVVWSSVVLCCPLVSTKSLIPQINRLLKWPLLEPRCFSGKPVLTVLLCCPLLTFVVLGPAEPPGESNQDGMPRPRKRATKGQQSPPRKQIWVVCRGPNEGQQSPLQKQIRAVCQGFWPKRAKRRKAKSISYNVGNSTQVNRAAMTTDEKEEPNARAGKASRDKPERRVSTL
jgi:hypothetical protein